MAKLRAAANVTQARYGASRPDEGFSKRNARGAIVGLFGGHAEFIKWEKYYRILADPNKNSLWCYPGSANGR